MDLDTAYQMVLADLEDNNNHTVGRLLYWHKYGTNDKSQNELMYRTWLVAKKFLYGE